MPLKEPVLSEEEVLKMELAGKTAVVTGATAGVGLATAKLLTGLGARVIGVGRTEARCAEALRAVKAECPGAEVEYCAADLSSQRRVRALAEKVRTASGGSLDALINNAGAVSSWFETTEDGIELQLAVNHLAPFLLTHLLLPLLSAAPTARVVALSSGSHYRTRLNLDDLQLRRSYSCLAAYKQSKLANMMFTLELNRRLGAGASVRAVAVDPGLVRTEIGLKGTAGLEKRVWRWRMRQGSAPALPAVTVAFAAFAPEAALSAASLWKDLAPLRPSRYALREREARLLWEQSERLCGLAHTPDIV